MLAVCMVVCWLCVSLYAGCVRWVCVLRVYLTQVVGCVWLLAVGCVLAVYVEMYAACVRRLCMLAVC